MQKMNAPLQYRLDHADLALVLALVRGGSLARAAELLRVDVATVFRAIRHVLCASERYLEGRDATEPAMLHWIAPDDFLPDHPSVVWRRRHYPGVLPAYRCNGVLAVAEMARAGLGLAAIPAYLLRDGDGLRVLDADLEGCASALWLLTRPDCRALRSVVALFDELGRHVRLGDE